MRPPSWGVQCTGPQIAGDTAAASTTKPTKYEIRKPARRGISLRRSRQPAALVPSQSAPPSAAALCPRCSPRPVGCQN